MLEIEHYYYNFIVLAKKYKFNKFTVGKQMFGGRHQPHWVNFNCVKLFYLKLSSLFIIHSFSASDSLSAYPFTRCITSCYLSDDNKGF